MYYLIKISITVAIIMGIGFISKKSVFLGSFLAALPLVSLLALGWMWYENTSIEAMNQFSKDIFWLVLAGLPFFQIFPYLTEHLQLSVGLGLAISSLITGILYLLVSSFL